jgi:hypothetical protein
MNQLEKKQESFQARQKKVRGRRAIWEEINDGAEEEKRKTPRFQVLGEDGHDQVVENGNNDEEWEDEQGDAEMKVVDGIVLPASAALNKIVVVDRTASNAGSDLEDIT